MEYGTQLVSLCVVLLITIEFFQYRRLRLFSTRLFAGFLFLTIFSISFEILSSYSLRNPQFFSITLSRLINQLYIGSIIIITYYIYLYIDLKTKYNRPYSVWEFTARTIPLVIGIIGLLFGTLEYHSDFDGMYSYGSVVDIAYIICPIYLGLMLLSLILAIKNRSAAIIIKYDCCYCLTSGLAIAIYHYLTPTSSYFSLALVLFVIYVYISYENTKENEDKEIRGILSRNAFEATLKELYGEQNHFWVISFSLQNIASMTATYSQDTCIDCIEKSIKSIPDFKHRIIFRIAEYTFGFVIFKKDELEDWYARYKVSDKALTIQDSNIEPSYFVCAIECPNIAPDLDAYVSLLDFCRQNFDAQNDHSMFILDKDTAQKRDYLLGVEKLIQKAIDDDGFSVVYQPIINTKTGKCESAEALVRIKDTKTYGFVSPEVFIPLAERKGLISKLGDQVFFKVCRFAREARLVERGIKYIEVNLSGIQIADPTLTYRLHQCVKSFALDPSFINIEVTETAAVTSGKIAADNVEKLKNLGYRFSMDDFGTGYSNFSQIAEIAFDLIKLDKSLIWPAFDKEKESVKAKTVLIACIQMIKTLGFKIVAEGVETQEQADFLTKLGVDYLQGYKFSKPISPRSFANFIDVFNKVPEPLGDGGIIEE